jgi:hypothetical protein
VPLARATLLAIFTLALGLLARDPAAFPFRGTRIWELNPAES